MAELKIRLARAEAKANLVTPSLTILGFQIQYVRLPSREVKEQLIELIQSAASIVPLSECLDTIKLSAARFRAWIRRQRKCELTDHASCPKLSPTKLLAHEVSKIKDFVRDPTFQHFSITSLALHAKKCGKVVSSLQVGIA